MIRTTLLRLIAILLALPLPCAQALDEGPPPVNPDCGLLLEISGTDATPEAPILLKTITLRITPELENIFLAPEKLKYFTWSAEAGDRVVVRLVSANLADDAGKDLIAGLAKNLGIAVNFKNQTSYSIDAQDFAKLCSSKSFIEKIGSSLKLDIVDFDDYNAGKSIEEHRRHKASLFQKRGPLLWAARQAPALSDAPLDLHMEIESEAYSRFVANALKEDAHRFAKDDSLTWGVMLDYGGIGELRALIEMGGGNLISPIPLKTNPFELSAFSFKAPLSTAFQVARLPGVYRTPEGLPYMSVHDPVFYWRARLLQKRFFPETSNSSQYVSVVSNLMKIEPELQGEFLDGRMTDKHTVVLLASNQKNMDRITARLNKFKIPFRATKNHWLDARDSSPFYGSLKIKTTLGKLFTLILDGQTEAVVKPMLWGRKTIASTDRGTDLVLEDISNQKLLDSK